MTDPQILGRLDELGRRLDGVVERLERIESALASERDLRDRLAYEVEARRRLGDQTEWLIGLLGDAQKRLEEQRGKRG